jgi:hypothetical protein
MRGTSAAPRFHTLSWCLTALLLTLFIGCGSNSPELVPVRGTVTWQAKPLAGASVTFIPQSGSIAVATTDDNGQFEMRTGADYGCVIGPAVVTVSCMKNSAAALPPTMTPDEMQKMAMSGELQKSMSVAGQSLIPEKYGVASTSGLTAEVTAGKTNEFQFDLKP